MFIYAGLMLNFSTCAALYRPLNDNWPKHIKEPVVDKTIAETNDIEVNEIPEQQRIIVDEDDGNMDNKKSCCQRCAQACSKIFDLPLLKEMPFLTFALLNSLSRSINSINNSFLASLATDKGFDTTEITLIIMLTNLIGIPVRIVTGLIFDRKFVRKWRLTLFGWIMLVLGVFTFSIPIMPGVIPTLVMWCLYEAVAGISESQQATFAADIVGRKRLTSAIGMMRLLAGVSSLIGPVVGGEC